MQAALANLPPDLRCNLCGITCKSREALQRHIQYSELHAKILQKVNETNAVSGEDVEDPPPGSPIRDMTGAEVKLLYTGSKLFYRNNSCIDFTIYHHVRADCVEVIGCEAEATEVDTDPEGGVRAGCNCSGQTREIRRMYLDYNKLLVNIEAAVQAEAAKRLHAITERNKGNINVGVLTSGPSCTSLGYSEKDMMTSSSMSKLQKLVLPNKHCLDQQTHDSITRTILINWVLNRLQLSIVEEGTEECELFFAQNSMDNVNALPQITKPPNLAAYRAHGRRITYESEDIDEAINETQRATLKANRAVVVAESIYSKVFSAEKQVFIERADSAVPRRVRRETVRKNKVRTAQVRARWRWAIHRVVIQNTVAAVKDRLREIELIQMLRANLISKGTLLCHSNQAKSLLGDQQQKSCSNSEKSGATNVDYHQWNCNDGESLEDSHDSTSTVNWLLHSPPSTQTVPSGGVGNTPALLTTVINATTSAKHGGRVSTNI